MAATTGPTNQLPGSLHPVPPGTKCDKHPERMAMARIQGETDSMGAELIDCCDICAHDVREAAKLGATDRECDGCQRMFDQLNHYRDPDEGVAGRLYQLCDGCVAQAREQSSDNSSTGIADESEDGYSDENALEVDVDDEDDHLPDFGEMPTDFVDLEHIGPFDPAPRKR
ncbi:hypothetical protein D3C71_79220 [compost metagenome]